MKRLVLDIGSSAIRLCELSQTKAGYQLSKYYQRELLNDPALDEEAKKQQRLEALKALLKEAKVRTRKTIMAVPGRSVFTRTRTLPPVPEYKVNQIVKYEIQQQIPFALDQISLDYQILSRSESGSYDVMMAAIKVDVVEKHTDILRDVKRSIHAVDVSPIAGYNWLKHCGEFGTDGECVAMLDMGASTTDIVIERAGQFRFTRPLNLGGDDITNAIVKTFNLSFADAEKAKRQRAFAPTGDPRQDGKLGETVGQVLNRLVNEISRSFGYFRSLPGGGTVDRVVITGGGACLRNIVPYLKRQLNVEVRIARPLAGLAVGAAAQQANEHPEQSCVALGMALRCCEKVSIEINLIPPRVLEAVRRKEQVLYWILSFIVLGFIAASIIPAREKKDQEVREQITTLEQYIQRYDPVLVKNPERKSEFEVALEEKNSIINARLKDIENLRRANKDCIFWLQYLLALNQLRPEGGRVWFSSVETSVIGPKGGGAAPGAGRPVGKSGSGGPGVNSTGFSGIWPNGGAGHSGSGGAGGGGAGAAGGGGDGAAGGAKSKASKDTPPPKPNGLKVLAYAKDPDSITQFITRLKESDKFKGGVFFTESLIEKVPIFELDNARVSDSAGTSHTASAKGPGGPVTQAQGGETVLFFRVDLKFTTAAPPPGQPAAPPGPSAPGAAPARPAGTGGHH